MSETPTTPFSSKVMILAELWMDYRDVEPFTDLLTYGDLGFPLSYAISEKIVESTPLAEEYINELWELFLGQLEIEDNGLFDTLTDVLNLADFGSMDT